MTEQLIVDLRPVCVHCGQRIAPEFTATALRAARRRLAGNVFALILLAGIIYMDLIR